MVYRLLADLTALVHLAFVVFVVLGGVLVLRRRGWAWLHLPAAIWGAWIELFGWICPLTHLEKWLRRRGGEPAYATGFIEHYLHPVLYPAGLSRSFQVGLGLLVLALNLAVYARVVQRSRRARQRGVS
jgi:hypothetical protein